MDGLKEGESHSPEQLGRQAFDELPEAARSVTSAHAEGCSGSKTLARPTPRQCLYHLAELLWLRVVSLMAVLSVSEDVKRGGTFRAEDLRERHTTLYRPTPRTPRVVM